MIYFPFDGRIDDVRVDMILIANKNKTSYDVFSVNRLFLYVTGTIMYKICNGKIIDFDMRVELLIGIVDFTGV